ncbi:MAG: hypothetical protein LBQ66_12030 [Planctomycetaceae bacterium]|nr:hypothetical protein [Planctomycetaceae bacterium]
MKIIRRKNFFPKLSLGGIDTYPMCVRTRAASLIVLAKYRAMFGLECFL